MPPAFKQQIHLSVRTSFPAMGALYNLDWAAVEILIAFYCLVKWRVFKGFVYFTSTDSTNQLCDTTCTAFSRLYSVEF